MSNFLEKLKVFLHDPLDKCLDIKTHEIRAKNYAEKLKVDYNGIPHGSDEIASCMERSLLPRDKIYQDFNEVRHPLCDGKIGITLSNEEKKKIFESVERTFEKIANKIKDRDEKFTFFYLWRNLLDEIFEEVKNENWAKYLPIFPADTRVPDHSIWEHLKVASAIKADRVDKILMQNNALFVFTISPVQEFIAQAKKTQDLFIGSFFLSYLTFIGMKAIIDKFGPTSIIYPDLYDQPLIDWFLEKELQIQVIKSSKEYIYIPTIPNKFIAILPHSNFDEIRSIAEKAKDNILQELKEIWNFILNSKELRLNEAERDILQKAIQNQMRDFPQIYWVAIPWKINGLDITIETLKDFFDCELIKGWKEFWKFVGENGEYPPNIGLLYQLIYSSLEKSLKARKNIRNFSPSVEEVGRKCSVCGERNVLFFRETKNKNKFIKFNKDAVDLTDRIEAKYIRDGEGLCSICFMKRTLERYLKNKIGDIFKDIYFPSTAEVAMADFKLRVFKHKNGIEELQMVEDRLRKLFKNKVSQDSPLPKLEREGYLKAVDAEWFFPENLNQDKIKKELGLDLDESEIRDIKKSIEELTKKYGQPNPYYALIKLDGDSMGKWLSGKFLPEIEFAYNSQVWNKLSNDFKTNLKNALKFNYRKKLLTPAIHASISTALRNYAIEFVRKLVEEEHLGKLVYAGGDDLLAFVNLKDLFDIMHKLRWAFSGQVKLENGDIKVKLCEKTGFVLKDGRYTLTMGPNATASMGVVIAHYKYPLQLVIKKVFEMEDYAKCNEEKDSFAIMLIKHSGGKRKFRAKWIFDDSEDTIQFLKYLSNRVFIAVKDNNQPKVSKRFIQKINENFSKLIDEKGYLKVSSSVFETELLRLLKRSYEGDKKQKKGFIQEVADKLIKFYWSSEGAGGNFEQFINALVISAFLGDGDARKMD